MAMLVVSLSCGGSDSPTSPTPPPPPAGAPTVTCPADITAASTNGLPVPVPYTAPTATGGVAPVSVSCVPAPGSAFIVGNTMVSCTATASDNQTGTCSFQVTITPPQPRISKTNFLAFGDSMTQGEVTTPVVTSSDTQGFSSFRLQIVPAAAYPRQLQLLLAARYTQQTIVVTNQGRAGETATAGAQRFPGVMSTTRPEVVLLLAGANDLSALGTAGFSTAAAAVESMAKEARFRGARVFIGTLPPGKAGGKNTIPASTLQAFNARLGSIASGEGAILVDLYSAMLSGVNTFIGNDGLHPTEIGYQKIADTFFNSIRADLEVKLQ